MTVNGKAVPLTKEQLLDVLGSYRRQIKRSGKEYPTVVLSDICDSITAVLRDENYQGMYKEDNEYRF